jgi:hypothetical protein
MARQQLARGIWAGFTPTESPFGTPNGMDENLRLIDDHVGLYTLTAPQPPGTPYPPTPANGAGQIYSDGAYAVFNAGNWKRYPPRKGIRAVLSSGTDCWDNTGSGWTKFSAEVSKPALDAVTEAGNAFVRVAQAAADLAQMIANATIYPTKAEMSLATPADGAWAVVINDPVADNNGNYIRKNGAWVFTTMQPASSFAVDALKNIIWNTDDPDRAVDFIDDLGFIIATLFKNGLMSLGSIKLSGAEHPIEGAADGVLIEDELGFHAVRLGGAGGNLWGIECEAIGDRLISIEDRFGFLLLFIGRTGIFTPMLRGSPSGPSEPALEIRTPMPVGQQMRASVNHIICYGQSLSRGTWSQPPISTSQPYANIMLAGGVLARPADPAYRNDDFMPLREQTTSVDGSLGETPVSGCLNGLTRRAVVDSGTAAHWRWLGSAPGQGSMSVEQLSPGSLGYWERTIQLIKDAKDLCDKNNLSYSVWALLWYQGESDTTPSYSTIYSYDTLAYDYLQRWLTSMFDEMRYEIYKITGQTFSPYLFTYQVAGHRRMNSDSLNIAMAQWRASLMYDYVVMAAPAYIFPVVSDNMHLTNESSWLMGEYTGRAIYQTMIRRSGKWRPLEPVNVDWNDDMIRIRYHVPAGRIVIDNALCATTADAGFILRDGAGSVITGGIVSVSVTSRDEITIMTAPGIPADAVLTYARGKPGDPTTSGPATGARGNVRDTAGLYDTAISPLGNTFALHNASVMFEFSRKSGF